MFTILHYEMETNNCLKEKAHGSKEMSVLHMVGWLAGWLAG